MNLAKLASLLAIAATLPAALFADSTVLVLKNGSVSQQIDSDTISLKVGDLIRDDYRARTTGDLRVKLADGRTFSLATNSVFLISTDKEAGVIAITLFEGEISGDFPQIPTLHLKTAAGMVNLSGATASVKVTPGITSGPASVVIAAAAGDVTLTPPRGAAVTIPAGTRLVIDAGGIGPVTPLTPREWRIINNALNGDFGTGTPAGASTETSANEGPDTGKFDRGRSSKNISPNGEGALL